MNQLEKAFELFDAYNRTDPNTITIDSTTFPAEYFYALQLHHWVKTLKPDANEALLLASRAQHIGRWEIERSSFPDGKAGYLNWRTTLGKFHADKAGELMEQAGYDNTHIERVKSIIRKEKIKLDDDVQTIENALCLVFLQYQYEDFLREHEDDKVVHILQKTWKKMSDPGREAALGLKFSDKGAALIQKALA